MSNIDASNLSDSTELETITDDGIAAAIANLQSGNDNDFVSTFVGDDIETKIAALAAVGDSEPVKTVLDKVLPLRNIIVQRVELADQQTGEIKSQPRLTFVMEDGKAYHVTSPVVLRDVRTLWAVAGHPSTWGRPVNVKFTEGGVAGRRFVTMKVVATPAK